MTLSVATIGSPLDRVDGPAKVTGQARYAADQPVDNLAHGVLVQSTIAKGRVIRIDAAAAEDAPGVLAVITHHNAPRLNAPTGFFPEGEPGLPIQDDIIHRNGQPVAVVVAETLEQARYAATLVRVDYQTEQSTATLRDGLDEAIDVPAHVRGDPDQALETTHTRIDQTYTTAVRHHNPMEPAATTAVWNGDQLTLYESTMSITMTQQSVARNFGLPVDKVRVVSPFLGGGFGCKGFIWPRITLAAMAARHVGRPVKLVLTRSDSYSAHGLQTASIQRLSLGSNAAGKLTAILHDTVSQTSTVWDYQEQIGRASEEVYACPNLGVTQRLVRVNAVTPTPMRSPQEAVGMVALESAMDELAYALNVDPVELRIRNHADSHPESGLPWSSKRLLDCYRIGAQRFGWDRRTPAPRSMRRRDELVGWGMATSMHPEYRNPSRASVRIGADGRALVRSGSQENGGGTYTVITQIAADALGVDMRNVRFELGDTVLPEAVSSTGSMTVGSVGSATMAAGEAVRAAVIRLATSDERSPLHGATADQIRVENGRLFLTDRPDRGETYTDIVTRAGLEMVEEEGAWQPSEQPAAMASFGAIFTEVRVHPDTGEIRVGRLTGVYDIGRVVNPKTAASQMTGGIIWGLGQALLEHTVTDRRSGRVLTSNLSQYLVPVHADVPDIDVHLLDGHDPNTNLLGTKGAGELSAVGVAAALANAVYHATGKRVRDFPITLDSVL